MSEEAQLGLGIQLQMPWNSFGRKNIGYLFAIAHGAKTIWDFDDDNILKFWIKGAAPENSQLDIEDFLPENKGDNRTKNDKDRKISHKKCKRCEKKIIDVSEFAPFCHLQCVISVRFATKMSFAKCEFDMKGVNNSKKVSAFSSKRCL